MVYTITFSKQVLQRIKESLVDNISPFLEFTSTLLGDLEDKIL